MSRGRALAVGALLAAACGDNRFPIAILADQEIEAHCEQATRCGQYRDVNTCVFELDRADFRLPALLLRAFNPAYAAAVGSGQVHYDERAAAACVDALAAISCDLSARDARLEPDACANVFTGTVAQGGPCGFDEECASARCTPAALCPDDYTCCIGTCATPPHTAALGDACQIDSDCALDAFCSGAGCHALLADGESCSASAQCDFDLICNRPSPTQSGECGRPPQLGEACPGHVCGEIGTTCGSGGTCVELSRPGQPCATDFDCGPREVCTSGLVCAVPPQLGDPCSASCAVGAWCNADDHGGTCDVPVANGTLCVSPEQCASGYCADGDFAETCIDRPVCF